MSRYTVAALVASVYIVALSWVVRNEGESYRKALRRDPADASRSKDQTRGSAPSPREATPAVPGGPVSGSVAALPVAESAPVAPAPSVTAPEIPASAPTPTPVAVATDPAIRPEFQHGKAAAPGPHERDPAYVWADSLDLAKLSPNDERRLGRELNRLIMTANRRMESGNYEQRIDEVVQPLLAKRSRKDIEYTFTVLDTDVVGAFSHPGGYVYVCRGLFDMVGEDEDYIIEFVVGHEIAHVDLGHAVKTLEPVNAEEKKRGVGTLLQFYMLIAFGNPDAQEFEADAWVFQHMKQQGCSRRETLAFLRKFKKYAEAHGFGNGGKLPDVEKTEASAVENHFRALPAAWKRLSRLEELAGSVRTHAASVPSP